MSRYNLGDVLDFLIFNSRYVGDNILVPRQSTETVTLDPSKRIIKGEVAKVAQAHCPADDDAQEYFLEQLISRFPDTRVIVEEDTPLVSRFRTDSPHCFIIDTLDGTSKYGEGSPNFGVSLGYSYDNQMQIAVVYLPRHHSLFSAIRGDGARLGEQSISLDMVTQPKEGDKIVLNSKVPDYVDTNLTQRGIVVIRPHCTVYGMSRLFLNEARAYLALKTNVHDMAPSAFIFEQAGGIARRFDGSSLDISRKARITDFAGASTSQYRKSTLDMANFTKP